MSPHRFRRLAAAVLAGVAATAGAAPAVAAEPSCSRYASPAGSDAAPGTADAPYRTVQRLIDGLGAGETGCLAGGTYTDDGSQYVARFGHGGAPGAPLTLRSAPGARATLRGAVYVPNGSDHVTMSGLVLDGRRSDGVHTPSPQVMAADTVFDGNEITNGATDICLILGNTDGWGRAARTVVRGNLFRDCGSDTHFDHSIYVEAVDDAQIVGNVFVRTSGWAVHIYPDAQRTHVAGNVMHDNGGGVIFAGDGSLASNDNVVERNVISASRKVAGITSSWGDAVGRGNVARANCLSNPRGDLNEANGGFTATDNASRNPGYVDAAGGDLRLRADSPCRAVVGDAGESAPRPAPGSPDPAGQRTAGTDSAPSGLTRTRGHGRARKASPRRRSGARARCAATARGAKAARRTRSGRRVRKAAVARCLARASRRATRRA